MAEAEEFDAALESTGRRSFLKKLAIGTAFATPVVSSFTMSGINAVYAQTPSASGGIQGTGQTTTTTTTAPNQTTTSTSTTTTTSPNSTS